MATRIRLGRWSAALVAAFTSAGVLAAAAQTPARTAKLVRAATLQKLLPPAPAGWTRAAPVVDEIVISPECSYTVASAWYTKDEVRVKITLADTGLAADSLMALATMVVTLPDDYADEVPPATTIRRVPIAGFPGAELWDAAKNAGEITVLVAGRLVAKVETTKGDTLETLRTLLGQVDLKALAAIK